MGTEDQIKNILDESDKVGEKIENYANFIAPMSKPDAQPKVLEGLQTHTFLDQLYLNSENKPLGGIPLVVQLGVVGLSGVGKSLLAQDVVLHTANEGKKVIFVISEDIWNVGNKRYDLESRMKEKASALNLDWEKIKANMFVLDAVTFTELREWGTFSSVYQSIVESSPEQIDLLVIDSITLMESYRAAIKNRILWLSRYNQQHGITGLYVCQRSEEETDRFAIAGGISIAHNLDSVICMDFGKASGKLKNDIASALNKTIKQWDLVHFTRILSCRICSFDRKYIPLEITDTGTVKIAEPESAPA
jgi:KaiC/GvpD/RAD55 family RecA-like ATPase